MKQHDSIKTSTLSRRTLLRYGLVTLSLSGLLTSFGMFLNIILKYLYPQKKIGQWFFVSIAKSLRVGQSLRYTTPQGQSIIISRIKESGGAKDFIALSDICPHLGCKVYWQGNDKTFFCPCHNGKFDSLGKPLTGPPAQAQQELLKFPLKIEKGLLYIKTPQESLLRLSRLRLKHDKKKKS